MPNYRVVIRVTLEAPDAPQIEEAAGDGEAAEATYQGPVVDPVPVVRAHGSAGILEVVLRDMTDRSITTRCAKNLIRQLHQVPA